MPSSEERYNRGLIYVLDALNLLSTRIEMQYGHLLQSKLPADRYNQVMK
jgi:hypothetical protein